MFLPAFLGMAGRSLCKGIFKGTLSKTFPFCAQILDSSIHLLTFSLLTLEVNHFGLCIQASKDALFTFFIALLKDADVTLNTKHYRHISFRVRDVIKLCQA